MAYLSELNLQLFYFFHNFAGKNIALDTAIVFFGQYYVFFLIGIAAVFVYKDYRAGLRGHFTINLLGLCATLGTTNVVMKTFRYVYHHPRPFAALNIAHLLTEPTYSFPSGHTILIFGLATGMYFYNKKLALFLYASGVVVGVARIAAGVHYPFDILGGIVLGILTGFVVEWACRKYLFKKYMGKK